MSLRRLLTPALVGAMLLVGGTAGAQGIDARHDRQQERIDRGVATGRLTPREAGRLDRQQGRIDRAEDRMRARHGGYLTQRDRMRLRHRENRASRHIYRDAHNGRGY